MQRQSRAAEYPARSSFTVDGRERDGMLGPVVRACFRYRFDTAHLRCGPYGAAVAESAAAAVRADTQTSNRFAAFVDEASERFSVPVNWIGSVINIESAGDVHARSPKGAMGLMQIMPSTWAELRERHNLGRSLRPARQRSGRHGISA